MRVLIAGSREFCAGYRIDRALLRASKNQQHMTVITIGDRTRRGADRIARELADEFGWELEMAQSVSEARADVCIACLHFEDPRTDKAQITALKAEKAGIPVWRYYEGGSRGDHCPQPVAPSPDDYWDDMLACDPEPVQAEPFGSSVFAVPYMYTNGAA